jgi:DNA polymerase III alpha subunit
MTLAGIVRFQAACAAHAIQPIVGVELAVADVALDARWHLLALALPTMAIVAVVTIVWLRFREQLD